MNAAVLTAMNADLSIDLDRMAAHCRWLLANGCNGLGVLGTTGEANSLGISERIEVLEGLVARGIPAAKMMPGTGTTAITDTVLLTRKAEELGCRGALLLPPFYYKNPSDDGLLAYFNEVIQRVGGDIRLYLYNFPQQSAMPFTCRFHRPAAEGQPGQGEGHQGQQRQLREQPGLCRSFASDGFEVYAGDDYAAEAAAGKRQRRLHHRGIQRELRDGRARSMPNWNTPAGAAAQEVLAATRKAVISVPLIPGLKALVARNTGDARWHNIRPPHMQADRGADSRRCSAFDACGILGEGGLKNYAGMAPHRGLSCFQVNPATAASRYCLTRGSFYFTLLIELLDVTSVSARPQGATW